MNEHIEIEILGPAQKHHKRAVVDELKMLWKDTFHDSNAYIDLLYDNYIDDALIGVCRNNNGDIIASLTAIPYRFNCSFTDKVVGWYFCGLSTKPEYRRRGLMERLIIEARQSLNKEGEVFTFLIPADRHLRDYYAKIGYLTTNGRTVLTIKKSDHHRKSVSGDIADPILERFIWSEASESDRRGIIEKLKEFEALEFRRSIDANAMTLCLAHDDKDWKIVLKENEISKGEIYIIKNAEREMEAVAFGALEDGRYEIKKILGRGITSVVELVKQLHRAFELKIYLPNDGSQFTDVLLHALSDWITSEESNEYTMISATTTSEKKKIMAGDTENVSAHSEFENPIISANRSQVLKYSIFMNEAFSNPELAKCHITFIADLLLD